VFCLLGRYAEAEQELRRAIELRPKFAEAHLNLGTLLRDRGQFAASETALRRAVKFAPNNSLALASLGLTLGMRAQLSDARGCFEAALRLTPGDASALCSMGWLAGVEGRFDEAEQLCRKALEADPKLPGAWATLAELRRMTPEDKDWLEGVEKALAAGVPPLEEAKLRFAMGKYFDDVGNSVRAFEQYKRGNQLQKRIAVPYDRAARTAFVDDMIRVYPRQQLAPVRDGVSDSVRPVLVTGMMRSGTSLVEQIIASHPKAAGAGELGFWNNAALRHAGTLRREPPDPSMSRRLAESYLATLAGHSADAERVVDKSTFNSDHLGLIHQVFPRARIIYMRRDPIDTCLSCYFQDFANMASFAMDLADLAHYYREHHRLIEHWRAALPEGALLEVPYGELVVDQEAWSRRIIEFIGLEWDPGCLEFHRTRRAVVTASQWQVRQRIYSRSVGRWQHYKKFIGPLLELQNLTT
jgi:cytochrome c-type biogenesis protein CcmH/NrfG